MNINKKTTITIDPRKPEEHAWWQASKDRLIAEGFKLNETSSTVCWLAIKEEMQWHKLKKESRK